MPVSIALTSLSPRKARWLIMKVIGLSSILVSKPTKLTGSAARDRDVVAIRQIDVGQRKGDRQRHRFWLTLRNR